MLERPKEESLQGYLSDGDYLNKSLSSDEAADLLAKFFKTSVEDIRAEFRLWGEDTTTVHIVYPEKGKIHLKGAKRNATGWQSERRFDENGVFVKP